MPNTHRVHFGALDPDEKKLVRAVQPRKDYATPKTKRHICLELGGWSVSKFWKVQRSLIDKGWAIRTYDEVVTVHRGGNFKTIHRPLFRLLNEEEHYISNARTERNYNVARTRTGQLVQGRGEVDNPLSQPIYDEEQRLNVSNNVLRGEPTAVPVGHGQHDPDLKKVDNGDEVLTEEELAQLLAPMLKQHPNNR
jgi:hypothetical protein